FRAFHLTAALASVAALAAAALVLGTGERPLDEWLRRDRRFLHRLLGRCRRSRHRELIFAFVVCSLPIVLRPMLLPPLGWDTLTYHGVKAAMWVQYGGELHMDAPGPWAHYQALWGGGEVFTAWAMLPFHSDLLAMWVDALEWIALGVSLVALARELGIREPYASAVSGLALAIPSLRVLVGSGYVETCELMAAASGSALTLRFLKRPSPGSFWLAAAVAGVAASVKLPFLPLALILVGASIARLLTVRTPHRDRMLQGMFGLALFAASIAPWVWQSYRKLGQPLSPLPIHVFGLDLGLPSPELRWYEERPRVDAGDRLYALAKAFFGDMQSPGAAVVLASLIGIGAWPKIARRLPGPVIVLGSLVVVNWAEYFSSGFSVVRDEWPVASIRFLLPALMILVVFAGAFGGRHSRAAPALFLLICGSTFFLLVRRLPYGLSAACAGALLVLTVGVVSILAFLWWLARRPIGLGCRTVAACLLVALALVPLDGLRGRIRADLLRAEFTNHDLPRYWVEAALIADEPAQPRRIAVTSGAWKNIDNWFVLPFIGRRLQNEAFYVPVSKDGEVRHFGEPNVNVDYYRSADYASWRSQLLAGRVAMVMSFSPASIELGWMETRPGEFRRLAGENGDWGLFWVVRGSSRETDS
ncbi:MAG TPA: hypothetical protein VLF14_00210, partial [Candidatus Binatia bacterium]|nr:hypothetical protein [Candidatus Binatia bacterium]